MDRLTVKWKPKLYDALDPIDIVDNEYSKANFEKLLVKLGEYEDAEEQGLMKVLPVAIGSDIYFIPSETNYRLNILNYHEENNRVYRQKVARITFNQYGWYIECDKNIKYGVEQIFIEKSYKVTWFTDESEAESALAEMKNIEEAKDKLAEEVESIGYLSKAEAKRMIEQALAGKKEV